MKAHDISEIKLTRRSLLIGVAVTTAGVMFTLSGCKPSKSTADQSGAGAGVSAASGHEVELNAWVVIRPDNIVVIKIPQTELGQGAITAVAQMLAEEIDVEWKDIHPEFYEPAVNLARKNVYVWAATLSSSGVSLLFDPVRLAGAQIRTMLLLAASKRLGVPVGELRTAAATVVHAQSDRRLTYAELAADAAALPIPDPKTVVLKSSANWRYIGKSMPRLDIPSKVDGSAVYGIDVKLPGMKFAAIRQSPVFGGKLKSFDAAAVQGRPGVLAVVAIKAGPTGLNEPTEGWGIDYGMDDAVAVVADDWWTANAALAALPIEWDNGRAASVSSARLAVEFADALAHPSKNSKLIRNDGDAAAAIATAAKIIHAEYSVPFTEHATMEPINCTAVVSATGVEVWAGSQFPDEGLRIAALHAGVSIEKARFHLTLAGGGFGRRIVNDYVAQAVQIAKAMKGTPVKLLWSREETIQRGYYAPFTVTRLTAGLDSSGKVAGWLSRSVGGRAPDQSYGPARMAQVIPNIRVDYEMRETPAPFGWKRGVGFAQHTWMNQCFLDELAHAAGRDPLAFQLSLLNESALPATMEKRELQVERIRLQRAVLEEVARRAGWTNKLGPHRGKGLAVHDMSYWPEYHSSASAAVVEVSIDAKRQLKVERVVVVMDCGQVLNPDNAAAQVQGGVAFALTDAMRSEITMSDGKVVQSNFHDYPMLGIADMPKVEVYFMPGDGPPHGIGEHAVPLVIAALVNAVHGAGGPRIRSLPIGASLAKT